jgi:hypothetical protein
MRPPGQERRSKSRLKISQVVRVRPSTPGPNDFDEILPTLNSSRESVYFVAQRDVFVKNMRLFVTYPYSKAHNAINQEYIGRVTRIDQLADGKQGVAVQLLMPIRLSATGDSSRASTTERRGRF